MLGDDRIADRALAALRGATDAQVIVANDPGAASWFPGETIVADAVPGLGPLGGLETALRTAGATSVIVVAWDMPFVETPLLRGMRAMCELGVDAVVPEHGNPPQLEPLCACYAATALPMVTELLARGERRARSLAEYLSKVIRIPERVLVEHGDPDRFFMSVDDPEQLELLRAELARR